MFEAVTDGIHVKVKPVYVADQSSPDDAHFVWAYHIVIQNKTETPVQLIERHWVITDASGQVQDVRGQGVVGEQPTINPGDSYAYTSGVNLRTPSGFMQGEYTLLKPTKDAFEVVIPAFSLDLPVVKKVLN